MKEPLKLLGTAALLCGLVVFGALSAWADTSKGTIVGSDMLVKTSTITIADSLATQVAALTSTSGLAIDRGGAVALVVCAEATRTITSGAMRSYVYMPVYEPNLDGGTGVSYLWMPYPALDFTPTASERCSASGDKQALSGIGRIIWLEDTIVVSAGTTITSTISVRKGLPR